jgi:hypothetical protein
MTYAGGKTLWLSIIQFYVRVALKSIEASIPVIYVSSNVCYKALYVLFRHERWIEISQDPKILLKRGQHGRPVPSPWAIPILLTLLASLSSWALSSAISAATCWWISWPRAMAAGVKESRKSGAVASCYIRRLNLLLARHNGWNI